MAAAIFFYVEIDRAVADVGKSCVEDFLDEGDLLDDVPGGAGLDGGGHDVQFPHSLMVVQGVCLYHLHRLQLLKSCLFCDFILPLVGIVFKMPDIGNIAHIADFIPEIRKQPEKDVVCDARPCMPQMGVSVNGGAADIHPDP